MLKRFLENVLNEVKEQFAGKTFNAHFKKLYAIGDKKGVSFFIEKRRGSPMIDESNQSFLVSLVRLNGSEPLVELFDGLKDAIQKDLEKE